MLQNTSGYESLKSKGLEIVQYDSLRFNIISLYEYDFNILRKFEEDYNEMQFHKSYFKEINTAIAPNLMFDPEGNIANIKLPLKLSSTNKKILLVYLWKIEHNRAFLLDYYNTIEEKILQLNNKIETKLNAN